MSIVPPARSMRVGAEVSMTTKALSTSPSCSSRSSWFNKIVPRSLRREIGQLLIGSLPATTITPEMRSLAREFQLGGITLFKRNIEAPEQVAELAYELQSLSSDLPLWVAADQEG